jgi:hypothetical protein
VKLFDAPLPEEAIEELLKVANLEDRQRGAAKKGGKKAAVALVVSTPCLPCICFIFS